MATARLVASAYAVSNATYVSVSNADNMYTNTDSTTYATLTSTRSSTTSYYVYIRGFNLTSLPSDATVNSFSVKIKGYETGISTNASYAPCLVNGTSAISNTTASSNFGTTSNTITVPNGALTWSNVTSYGTNFGVRVTVRRASSGTQGYVYVQGVEIEVNYTVPDPVVITSTLTGNGTIVPNGATNLNKGDTYTISITPTNASDPVSITNNGVNVTSELVPPGSEQEDRVLGTYALVSGGFNGSGASYFQGLVGKGVDNTKTTSNYYSSGNGTIAVFTYDMSFEIPAGATITRVWCEVNGHAESTSQSSEYMCAQLISGSTNLSSELNFKSIGTSNSTQTLEATTLPTIAQLAAMKLQCRLGYYGGAINGATAYVTFEIQNYTYTYVTTGDATIAVVIGSPSPSEVIYFKNNGSWVAATAVYKKVNGSWVEQSDLTTVFSSGVNYIKGG